MTPADAATVTHCDTMNGPNLPSFIWSVANLPGSEWTLLTAEAERAIDLLHERRTVLISAAVTGKIDVRELAQPETA